MGPECQPDPPKSRYAIVDLDMIQEMVNSKPPGHFHAHYEMGRQTAYGYVLNQCVVEEL